MASGGLPRLPLLDNRIQCADKSGKSSDAMSQVAAASMLWLYQRRQISDALHRDLDGLRQYAIIFVDAEFTVNKARFKDGFYEVRALAAGNLTQANDLDRYIEWSNTIYAWGLGPNATSSRNDIRALVKREKDRHSLPLTLSINSLPGSSAHSSSYVQPTTTAGL